MKGRFPAMSLAVNPPFTPMEAHEVDALPSGAGWQFEPKWDGFRCLVFRDARTVVLQAKSGEPLTRYFPELVMAMASLPSPRFVLDGEIVVIQGDVNRLSYDELSMRMHPSARKVAQLSARSPATFIAFDLLDEEGESLLELSLTDRRKRLERFFKRESVIGVQLSPQSSKKSDALGWLRDLGGAGIDGVMGKRKDAPYVEGGRESMVKLKVERTVDCVVGGVRRAGEGDAQTAILLLGLYDNDGLLHFVGTTAPLPAEALAPLAKLSAPLAAPPAFTGQKPPARASTGDKSRDFESLRPELVCEVRFDRFVVDRFRSAPAFLRFRADKKAAQCTLEQLHPTRIGKGHGLDLLGL